GMAPVLDGVRPIGSSVGAERLYDPSRACVGEALAAQSGVLWVGERDELTVAAVRGLPTGGRRLDALRIDAPMAAKLKTGEPFPWPEDGKGLRIPLVHKGNLLGLLELSDRFDGRPFDVGDRSTASLYAGFCGIALSNASQLHT